MLLLRVCLAALIFLLLGFQQADAFVFLGPAKPRLKPADGHTQVFHLTPVAPSFIDKETFEDGFYSERSDGEIFALLVERSMLAWNEIPELGIQLGIAEVNEGKIDPEDNLFSIGVGKISTVASGLAFPVTDEKDPSTLRDCDIQVGTDIDSIPSFIFVMIHELGHCLGLGHNHSDPLAIMGYWQPRKEVALGFDDIAGVLSLYPPKVGEQTNSFAPCGSLVHIRFRQKYERPNKNHPQYFRKEEMNWGGLLMLFAGPALFWLASLLRPLSSRHLRPKSDQ